MLLSWAATAPENVAAAIAEARSVFLCCVFLFDLTQVLSPGYIPGLQTSPVVLDESYPVQNA
jgi:hypothetical protein